MKNLSEDIFIYMKIIKNKFNNTNHDLNGHFLFSTCTVNKSIKKFLNLQLNQFLNICKLILIK